MKWIFPTLENDHLLLPTNINNFANQMNARSFEKVPSVAQLERAREVIVGRQLEHLERRLDELEQRLSRQSTDPWREGVEEIFSAMQNQMAALRKQLHQEISQRQQEMAQAVGYFQQSLQHSVASVQDGSAMEQRLHAWLSAWQQAMEQHLIEREQWLLHVMREEWQRAQQASSAQIQHQVQQQVQQQLATAVQTMNAAAHSLSQMARNFTPTV